MKECRREAASVQGRSEGVKECRSEAASVQGRNEGVGAQGLRPRVKE